MKKYPKLLQVDKRGQIVIPKDIRQELGIDHTTGFYAYAIPGEGILLKQVEPEPVDNALEEIQRYADRLGVSPQALKKTLEDYKRHGGLKDI